MQSELSKRSFLFVFAVLLACLFTAQVAAGPLSLQVGSARFSGDVKSLYELGYKTSQDPKSKIFLNLIFALAYFL